MMKTIKFSVSLFLCLCFLASNLLAQPANEIDIYTKVIIKDMDKYGYSLSSVQHIPFREIPKKLDVEILSGNQYTLVMYSMRSDQLQCKGTPGESYNQLAALIDKLPTLSPFTSKAEMQKSVHQIDHRGSPYNVTYAVEVLGKPDGRADENSKVSFFVFYKSADNAFGKSKDNLPENHYAEESKKVILAAAEEASKSAKATLDKINEERGYEKKTLEKLVEETEKLQSASATGLKYMNGKIAVDKWMEALIREARGDQHIYSTFDAMHEDWQKQYQSYKSNATSAKLLNELEGGFKQQGFNEKNEVVVDHIIEEKVVARYYFKIKKCEDYGRIVPQHKIENGKLHIIPWQRAVVPFSL